eukprot:324044_1
MTTKKDEVTFYGSGGCFSSAWATRYLIIKIRDDGSKMFQLYNNRAAYFTKQQPIEKSVIVSCQESKDKHEKDAVGFSITGAKKREYKFSCYKEERNAWIKFANKKMTDDRKEETPLLQGTAGNDKKITKSGTTRNPYGNDQEFQRKLDEYLDNSGLPEPEQMRVRKMPKDTLKMIIWENEQLKDDDEKETSKPEYWIKSLKSQTHPLNALQCLRRFIPAIKASSSSFVKSFGNEGGMDHLIKLISFSHGG